jgi:hypothetical protein
LARAGDDLQAAIAWRVARAEALAERGRPAAAPFANAATKSMADQERVWEARDWEATVASFPPTYRLDDRRRLMRLQLSGEAFFTQLRMLFDMPRSRWHFAPLATRGERLALGRVIWEGDVDEGGGALEAEYLEVFEVDAAGRCAASVLFDPDDLDAAYAELGARWEVSEGGEHATPSTLWGQRFGPALERRDWDAIAAVYSPSFVGYDHRLVGWGALRGPSVIVKAMEEMCALAPDARMRADHILSSARGFLTEAVWVGTREGGAFESPFIVVTEFDARGRVQRQDFYDPHHLGAALARFAELSGGPMPSDQA